VLFQVGSLLRFEICDIRGDDSEELQLLDVTPCNLEIYLSAYIFITTHAACLAHSCTWESCVLFRNVCKLLPEYKTSSSVPGYPRLCIGQERAGDVGRNER
jgi:hypothetical protein